MLSAPPPPPDCWGSETPVPFALLPSRQSCSRSRVAVCRARCAHLHSTKTSRLLSQPLYTHLALLQPRSAVFRGPCRLAGLCSPCVRDAEAFSIWALPLLGHTFSVPARSGSTAWCPAHPRLARLLPWKLVPAAAGGSHRSQHWAPSSCEESVGCPSAGAQRFRALAQPCWGDDGQQLPSRGRKHLALLPWGWQNVPCLGKARGLSSPRGTQPVGTVSCPRGGAGQRSPRTASQGVHSESPRLGHEGFGMPVLEGRRLSPPAFYPHLQDTIPADHV